jgi:hypothetical protein
MKASKILTDNRPIGYQSNIVEGSDGPVTDSRQISPHQQLRGNLMFSKMQSSVYQNRGGSQHHAPSVNDVRFGGIDTKISVDQKLVPAPRPALENTAAQEVIPLAMSTVTGTDRANLASCVASPGAFKLGGRDDPRPAGGRVICRRRHPPFFVARVHEGVPRSPVRPVRIVRKRGRQRRAPCRAR